MADYVSSWTGAQIDDAVGKALDSVSAVTQGDNRLLESGGAFNALLLKQDAIGNGGDCIIAEDKIWFGQTALALFNRIFKKPVSSFSTNKILAIDNQNNETFYSIGTGLKVAGESLQAVIQPTAKTTEMVQAVGVDSSGKLWTRAGGGTGGSSLYLHKITIGNYTFNCISPSSLPYTQLSTFMYEDLIGTPCRSVRFSTPDNMLYLGIREDGANQQYNLYFISEGSIVTKTEERHTSLNDTVTVWGE